MSEATAAGRGLSAAAQSPGISCALPPRRQICIQGGLEAGGALLKGAARTKAVPRALCLAVPHAFPAAAAEKPEREENPPSALTLSAFSQHLFRAEGGGRNSLSVPASMSGLPAPQPHRVPSWAFIFSLWPYCS